MEPQKEPSRHTSVPQAKGNLRSRSLVPFFGGVGLGELASIFNYFSSPNQKGERTYMFQTIRVIELMQ